MLVGWILGGPRKSTRPVPATAGSIRNITLCLAIAEAAEDVDHLISPAEVIRMALARQ